MFHIEPPEDATMFEVIEDAADAGWRGQLFPSLKRGERPPAFKNDANNKIWYYKSNSSTIPISYLKLLLSGKHQVVEHGLKPADYAKLLGLKSKGQLQIEDEDGAGGPRPKKRRKVGARRAALLPIADEHLEDG